MRPPEEAEATFIWRGEAGSGLGPSLGSAVARSDTVHRGSGRGPTRTGAALPRLCDHVGAELRTVAEIDMVGEFGWAIATDRIVPLVRPRVTVDLVRSAMARSVIEALWTPAALLPRPGAAWEPIDTDRAPALCSGIAAAFGRRAKGLSGNKCTIWGIIIR